jgi:uncharacterized membrane protein YphA (DoxX/SURF4 family)
MSSPALVPSTPPRADWLKRAAFAAMTFARFALALGMMPYGISKLFDMQFQVGASIYAQPLGSAPGTILTWAFLGYSPVFQVLLGVSETVPAILLLFARTRRPGALLLFPVLLNVVLFNYFLDLWPATQLISSVLLALNLFLLLYDFRMYADFLSHLVAKPEPIASRRLRIAAKVAALQFRQRTSAGFCRPSTRKWLPCWTRSPTSSDAGRSIVPEAGRSILFASREPRSFPWPAHLFTSISATHAFSSTGLKRNLELSRPTARPIALKSMA